MLRQASSNAADQATYAKFTNLADADKKRFEREKAEYVVLTRCNTRPLLLVSSPSAISCYVIRITCVRMRACVCACVCAGARHF